MATVTPNYNWPVPLSTDLVKDGADAIKDLGDAIDATVFGLGTGPDTVLSSGTFTTASAVNLSSVLTSTYSFYTINIYAKSSGNSDINLRWRENTTDYTATDYAIGSQFTNIGGTIANYGSNGNINMIKLSGFTSSVFTSVNLQITRPDATTGSVTWNTYDAYNNRMTLGAASNSSLSNFNGLSFFPSAGTFTGYYILTGREA